MVVPAAHKPFDSTMKELAERRPRPWMSLLLGRRVGDVQVINADLSTITAEADKLFRIQDPRPFLVHNEFETSYKAESPLKGLRYNVLARVRHGLPVQTIFVLLRREADGEAFTGTFEAELPDGTKYLLFRYNVVRVWELPPEPLLAGDLATLPLAPISRVSEADVLTIVRRVDDRIAQEASPDEAAELRAAAGLLLGLNHSGERLDTLLQGLHGMRESATYQMILAEGRAEGRAEGKLDGEKEILRRLGEKRFGPMNPGIRARFESIGDPNRLRNLADRLLEVSSWNEWLAAD
jgi:predicted transposase YdaD